MNRKLFAVVFCLALFGALLVPSAKADQGNQEVILTVKKGPVELPGKILEPGKYEMKFTDLEHQVVQVSTADGQKPIGFFDVIPISRFHRKDGVQVNIAEAAPGSVSRLTDFFYPGTKTGYKFEFPQAKLATTASKTN